MLKSRTLCVLVTVLLMACFAGAGPAAATEDTVVVFTALDRVYSEPLLRRFEDQTGVRVKAVYDAEAAKTTGLINRIIARRAAPECDVLWNNELVQTQRLAEMGLLEAYESPQAARFPAEFRDPQGRWTGFAARLRVLIYNTKLVPAEAAPTSLDDLRDPRWRGKAAIARPFFGTTLTHMTMLHQAWGPERLRQYLRGLRENQVALCAGNGPVRDMVAAGERALGLTDTDDAYGAMLDGKPVRVVIPDAGQGAVLIPNSVAIIRGCPHPAAARKLVDYLLSAEVERALAEGRSAQLPLASDVQAKTPWDELRHVRPLQVDIAKAGASVPAVVKLLQEEGMDQ